MHRGPKSNCAIVDENEPLLLQEKEKSLVLKSGLQLCPFDRRLLDRLDLYKINLDSAGTSPWSLSDERPFSSLWNCGRGQTGWRSNCQVRKSLNYFGAWLIILIAYLKISFSIFHTVLFHRSFGKFTYQDDSSYIIGTIGYEDVDCDYIGGKERFVFFSNI